MYMIISLNMLARIIIVSVIIKGVISNRRFPDLNQGTIVQESRHAPWRTIWTTLGPPTTVKTRKLSVYDTIKAAAAASRRVNGLNNYHQQVISPQFVREQPVFPTKRRHSSSTTNVKSTSTFRSSGNSFRPVDNSVLPKKQTEVHPTAETRFSGVQAAESRMRQSIHRAGAVSGTSATANAGTARSSSEMARRSHSAGDIGLHEEAGMFDVASISKEPMAPGHVDLFAQNPQNAIALYAVDHGHGHDQTTSLAADKLARTSNILERNSPTTQPRFQILSDGSIVNYGVSGTQWAMRQADPTASTHARSTDHNSPSSSVYAKNKVHPTSASRLSSSTGYRSSSASNVGHSVGQSSSSTHTQTQYAAPSVSPTQNSMQHTGYNTPRAVNAHGGVPVDDSLNYIIDDPRRRHDDRYGLNLAQRKDTGGLDYPITQTGHLSLEPTFTKGQRLSTTYIPASTTRRKTTTTTPPPTTTTTTTTTTTVKTTTPTTTTTTTTTTPKPKPKDDYWTKQGGVPINISYLHDNHVCPTSRARWQDYTVYLETKPRLCMIQVTFNARYKREPIYHNTWWGNNVEWIYKTVYDPEVKVVDLHGWGGSTWYG